jgi:hypothetical protein
MFRICCEYATQPNGTVERRRSPFHFPLNISHLPLQRRVRLRQQREDFLVGSTELPARKIFRYFILRDRLTILPPRNILLPGSLARLDLPTHGDR